MENFILRSATRVSLRTTFIQYFICDIFFETSENIDFTGYPDDNTPYTYFLKIEHVLTNLQGSSEKLIR